MRILVRHTELVQAVDLSSPVILGPDGELRGGMHRVAKCLVERRTGVAANRFASQPA